MSVSRMQSYAHVWCLCLCRLERRWVLWHEFMKEHAHLDAWLRLAEQAVTSPYSAHLTYAVAKEELRKFEVRSDATNEDYCCHGNTLHV